MVMIQPLNPRKRRTPPVGPVTETQLPVSKRLKTCFVTATKDPHRPPGYWDTLSKIWLTRGSLRELERRNKGAVPTIPSSSQISNSTTLPVYSKQSWQQVKRFARQGGPDLTDLRGVGSLCQRGMW